MKLISPAPGGWENLPFGSTKKPYNWFNRHRGKDWGYFYIVPASRLVVAPAPGVVRVLSSDGSYNNGWGNAVEIIVNRSVAVRLCHFATGSIVVKTGDRVNAGDLIGTMGATGNTGGQIHLHEELWVKGSRVDPDTYRTRDLPGTEPASTGGASTDQGSTPTTSKEWDEMATPEEISALFTEALKKFDDSRQALKIVGVVGGTMYLTGPGGFTHITSTDDLELLRRHVRATVGGEETFTPGQLERIGRYLKALG